MQHTEAVLFATSNMGLADVYVGRVGIARLGYVRVRGMAVDLESAREADRDTGMD